MKDSNSQTPEDIKNMRILAGKLWRVGWIIFALSGIAFATLFYFKEPSRFGFLIAAFFLSSSVWIIFGSKFIEKRNQLHQDR
jgi:hypothetical protein